MRDLFAHPRILVVEQLNADWKYHHETNGRDSPTIGELSPSMNANANAWRARWLCIAVANLEQEASGGAWKIASNEAAKLPGPEGEQALRRLLRAQRCSQVIAVRRPTVLSKPFAS